MYIYTYIYIYIYIYVYTYICINMIWIVWDIRVINENTEKKPRGAIGQ